LCYFVESVTVYGDERPPAASRDAVAPPEADEPVFDCGVNAIYLTLRLKGMDADLEEISKSLPRDAEKGSSIYDLETYLHSRGVSTDARLMRLSYLCKKRGALSILLTQGKDGTGHFVVGRVLANGQLQIIDSLFGAYFYKNASKSKENWPVILIDHKENTWAWKVFAGVGIVLLGFLCLSNRGGRREGNV